MKILSSIVFSVLCFFSFTYSVAQVTFTESNLPVILIKTLGGAAIPDEPKLLADMDIIYNGPGKKNSITDSNRNYSGKIAIERRGSSSQQLSPKKPYGFETRKEDGITNNNVSLLGLPKENDWILLAPYSDKSLIRDVLIHRIASDLMPYTSRTRMCELVVNNEYLGVYILMEKIKQDKNRVNIHELLPRHSSGDSLTGGYIIKIDKNTGGAAAGGFTAAVTNAQGRRNFYQYHEPESNELTSIQKNYIQTIVNNFETSFLSAKWTDPNEGYRKYADENSMIDFMILNEVSNNVDGYRLSSFLYKDVDSRSKKLKFGPIWDFNLAFGNANYCGGGLTDVMAYDFGNRCPQDGLILPFYWQQVEKDSAFNVHLYNRWVSLRKGVLTEQRLHTIIDSLVNNIGTEAINRNFQKWPILGIYIWPNNYIGGSYTNEIKFLKDWISKRLIYLDAVFKQLTLPKYYPERYFEPQVFPNPSVSNQPVTFQYYIHDYDRMYVEVYDLMGHFIGNANDMEHFNGSNSMMYKQISLPAGVYVYKLRYQVTKTVMKTGRLLVQ